MTPAELIQNLAATCRQHGVKRIKLPDGTEIEFGGEPVDPAVVRSFEKAVRGDYPADDDVLNWSAPGYVPQSPLSTTPPPVPSTAARED